jgi:hypothetical protein
MPYKVELHYSLSFITQPVPYVRINIGRVKCSKLFTVDFRSRVLFVEDQWQNNSSGFLLILTHGRLYLHRDSTANPNPKSCKFHLIGRDL